MKLSDLVFVCVETIFRNGHQQMFCRVEKGLCCQVGANLLWKVHIRFAVRSIFVLHTSYFQFSKHMLSYFPSFLSSCLLQFTLLFIVAYLLVLLLFSSLFFILSHSVFFNATVFFFLTFSFFLFSFIHSVSCDSFSLVDSPFFFFLIIQPFILSLFSHFSINPILLLSILSNIICACMKI